MPVATHCPSGQHEFTPENTRIRRNDGYRSCRACESARAKEGRTRWNTTLSPKQKAAKAARDKSRVRRQDGRVFTPEQRAARAKQKRDRRAWEAAHAYYLLLLQQRGVA